MPLQEPAACAALLEQARQKLQASLEFDRADTAPCNAMGEVLVAMSELAGQEPGEVAALLQRAVSEGYMLALNISRCVGGEWGLGRVEGLAKCMGVGCKA